MVLCCFVVNLCVLFYFVADACVCGFGLSLKRLGRVFCSGWVGVSGLEAKVAVD